MTEQNFPIDAKDPFGDAEMRQAPGDHGVDRLDVDAQKVGGLFDGQKLGEVMLRSFGSVGSGIAPFDL